MIKNRYTREGKAKEYTTKFQKCFLCDHRRRQGRKQAPCPRSVLL